MDKSLVEDSIVKITSELTGISLQKKHLTPTIIFTTALLLVVVGVVYADGEFQEGEKQNLKSIIDKLFAHNEKLKKFSITLVKGIIDQKAYRSAKHLLYITNPLSPEERLLLIALGYQMSASDGSVDLSEKKYLRVMSERLQVDPHLVGVLEHFFSGEHIEEENVFVRLKLELAPPRFQDLGILFVNAASHLIDSFQPREANKQSSMPTIRSESVGLREFREQLDLIKGIVNDLSELNSDGTEKNILSDVTVKTLQDLKEKIDSEYFRVAIVGEFSQGKSTLLNAWIGEEIQAVRNIPCSGCVTTLRYGEKKRVTCVYKNGTSQEISFDEYEDISTIDEDSALGDLSLSLASCNIEEIILEHPSLDICKHGLELVDSPGLNEHPERTTITEKLLDKTDAVIFLTNATRCLTQQEQKILKDLCRTINNYSEDKPAQNVFVVANFFDLLRREKDKAQIQERVKRLTIDNQLIVGENRLHFLSAQIAFEEKISGDLKQDNEYLQSFQKFIASIESFLTDELGSIKLESFLGQARAIVQSLKLEIKQFQDSLNGKISLGKNTVSQILEIIGNISGGDVILRGIVYSLHDNALEILSEIWDDWVEGLADRIVENSYSWNSESEDKQQIMKDYAQQFADFIAKDCHQNLESKVTEILQESVKVIESEMESYLTRLKEAFYLLDVGSGSHLLAQFDTAISQVQSELNFKISITSEDSDDGSGWFTWGGGALISGLLTIFTGGLFIPIALGGVAGGLLGWLVSEDPREKVLEKGGEILDNSLEQLYKNLVDKVYEVFKDKETVYQKINKQATAACANLLSQQELLFSTSQESLEIHKDWISNNQIKLNQLDQKLQDLQNSLVSK